MALGLGTLVAFERQVLLLAGRLPIGNSAAFMVLVHVNVLGIGLLVFLCARNVVKLLVDRRRGRIGAKLNTRFVVSFLMTAVVSTTALFLLAGFLVSNAVNTWFGLRVGDALVDSVEIADTYYAEAEARVLGFGERIARQIEQGRLMRQDSLGELHALIAQKQGEYGLGVVEVFSAQQEELASATDHENTVVAFESPGSALIAAGLAGERHAVVEEAGTGELLRAVIPVRSTFKAEDVVGVVVVNQFIPRALGPRVDAIHGALEVYREMRPSVGTFQTSMWILLAMITLVSVLFSSWMGFRLAKQVADPIQRLASATSELAAGNLSVRVEQHGEDEIGSLVASFNRMATDLQASRSDLERRRTLMEIILGGVAAGVISLDRERIVTTINPSALRLLGAPQGRWVGCKVGEVLAGGALGAVEELLGRLEAGPQETLRRQVPVAVGDQTRTLNWTVSRLRDTEGEGAGFVVVIDDVTQILRGQRMAAWRDVARRIAHEIKNPLTPIQLTAGRLQRKLEGRLDPDARKLLVESTDAIQGQVDAMKTLLSEFSRFARLPATDPAPTDLNALVSDTVAMYEGNTSISFVTDLARQLPALDLDGEQIKRVILNLVDNALASIEEAEPGPRTIRVSTRFDHAVGTVRLEVADTGTGIRKADRARLFQPGFSTKRDGSGIGLAIVSRIVSDHSGYIRVRANEPRGSRFIIELPLRT